MVLFWKRKKHTLLDSVETNYNIWRVPWPSPSPNTNESKTSPDSSTTALECVLITDTWILSAGQLLSRGREGECGLRLQSKSNAVFWFPCRFKLLMISTSPCSHGHLAALPGSTAPEHASILVHNICTCRSINLPAGNLWHFCCPCDHSPRYNMFQKSLHENKTY